MMRFGHRPLLLTFAIIFFGCDNNITISKNIVHYDARIHLSTVAPDEKLPSGVRELFSKDQTPKFPLSYYLIQEEDTQFIRSQNFDSKIIDQLSMSISNVRYYKLFVHPDSDASYSFLMSAYRYVGPEATEFFASPIPGNKTVVVWSPKALNRRPFIVKTVIDNATLNALNSRLPAESHLAPEIANLVFKRPIKGTTERIQGQQITSLPAYSTQNK